MLFVAVFIKCLFALGTQIQSDLFHDYTINIFKSTI